MKINFVLAAAATATIVLVDGGHPYQYEAGVWDQRSQNALVSSRQSPNPLNSRQALAALLTPGVAAAVASLAASVGLGTLQVAAANRRIDDTIRRVGTTEADITSIKTKATAETAGVTALQDALGLPDPYTGAKVYTALKQTCDQVKDIMDKLSPDIAAANVEEKIQATMANAYTVDSVITSFPGGPIATDVTGAPTTLTITNPKQELSTSWDRAAITLKTFDTFRGEVHDIVKELREKINEIKTASNTLTCPT